MLRRPSTKLWILIYVVFPLAPFLMGGVFRFITTSWKLSWNTFSASELAMCLALLSLFVNQSLVRTQRILDNEDKKSETASRALIFMLISMSFAMLFALIISFDTMVYELKDNNYTSVLRSYEIIVYLLMPLIISYSVRTQRGFRLKATLL